jgi:hypothetical protein
MNIVLDVDTELTESCTAEQLLDAFQEFLLGVQLIVRDSDGKCVSEATILSIHEERKHS